MTMTPDAKKALSSTIRGLRQRLLEDLQIAAESAYRLSVRAQDAGLDEAGRTKRKRLDSWLDEQVRAQAAGGRRRERLDFLREAEQQAAYTLLNRLVILRLMEEPCPAGQPLRKPALIKGGWGSTAYQDFRDLARGVVRDDPTEGFGFLLQLVCEELSEDLPGLFGSAGIADLIPIPAATLRFAVDELNQEDLKSCWVDDMTLGWIYQYWNDPERERLDAKINDGGKIEPHEIASKTQMFTERYMVDWMLQNSLGLMWFTLCKKNGWEPEVQRNGTLQHLEERRIEWRAKRAAGDVTLTELMPLESEEERRWAYFLPGQEIPDEAVHLAPDSVREWKILDPAVGSGHFLVVALGLLLALFQEEARHRGLQDNSEWSERAIVEHLLAHTLHGIDIDPRAVQIAAASLWLKAKALCAETEPEQLNLVSSELRLSDLPDQDPSLSELRRDIEAETGIPSQFTNQIIQALKGADHLGSLLRIDLAVEEAIRKQEEKVAWLRQPKQQELLNEAGATTRDDELLFSAPVARNSLEKLLDQFLARHSSASDLGLRLNGQQLASGVRLTLMLSKAKFNLVICNPPYLDSSKISIKDLLSKPYELGKSDLYGAFMQRGLEILRKGGILAAITMRGWMFIKAFSGLRASILRDNGVVLIGDLEWGAFLEMKDVKASMSIIRSGIPATRAIAIAPTGPFAGGRKHDDYMMKISGLLAQQDIYKFKHASFKVVDLLPFVYWWDARFLADYTSAPKLAEIAESRVGLRTSNNNRFVRYFWEAGSSAQIFLARQESEIKKITDFPYVPYIMGASGRAWIDNLETIISWKNNGLEICVTLQRAYNAYPQSSEFYFKPGISYSTIGSSVRARVHRYKGVFDVSGASVFPDNAAAIVCSMNSKIAAYILSSIAPTVNTQPGDIDRLAVFEVEGYRSVYNTVSLAFEKKELHCETSIEFQVPGPSPWRVAQEWAQLAVDRSQGAPLPEYIEELDPEPPTDHLSFALGVALGRFSPVDYEGQSTTSNQPGILDPSTADLSHALPAGILFLDGSLEENDHRDDLGQPAAAPLHQAWSRYGSAIAPSRSLRDWLRLDFFKDVHKGMYENRPIHWPLSSSGKTFVAWVNIHRMDERTLKVLLADHLIPARSRIDGELDDLRQVRDSEDRKAARAADTRLSKLIRWREELQEFISAVEQCADHGAPTTDGRCPAREQDAVYAPDLDDGVMINSAALWPLLEPQWKDPKKWWKEFASAQGKKDYDWAHLAMRYWPTRVDAKCKLDPSLGVAHGCFWRYHPERAWAWELRLQQEIGPDLRIEEPPYCPGGRDLGDQGDAPHRQTWLVDHPTEALAVVEKEATRRMGRGDNRQVVSEMRILEGGLWSVIPEKVSAMEQRLGDKQGAMFSLRAPDEAEGMAAIGEQVVQGGLFGATQPADRVSPMMGREAENTPC